MPGFRLQHLAVAAAALALVVAAGFAAEPIKNSACMDCHSDKTLTKKAADGKETSVFVDLEKFSASVHGTNLCVSCHSDITENHPDDGLPAKPAACATCHKEQSESYGGSVHGLALARGEQGSATCTDCHGAHDVLPPISPASPLHYSKLAVTCGGCHEQAAQDVEASVHGTSLAAGHREAPTCTDCHSEHKIRALKGSTPATSAEACSNCHASERLNTKYKMPGDRVKTFFESYHGLAAKYGSTTAANCGSCHGYHLVLPSSDPRSTIHPTNLVHTCGNCHPGATDNFAQSKIHVDISSADSGTEIGEQVNFWVRRIYLALIVGTIGFMLLHNGLLFMKKVAARYRAADFPVLRMTLNQRVQHITLAVSFIILAVTGFALKFPDSWVSKMLGSSESFRRYSHRVAGVVMLVGGAYHIYYVLRKREGRQLVADLWPRVKDVSDLAQAGKYLTGMSDQKPRIGRFGYAEKMEYWAVVWGTVIMGVTGLMIWFKMDVTQYLPRWAVDVATTVHYYEAILACLAIVVWHFYHVMFDPDVYPVNWAFWNGRVSRHWHEEEHPLEKNPEEPKAPSPSEPALRSPDQVT